MEYLNVLAAAAGAFAFGAVWYIAMSKPWVAAREVPVDASGRPAGSGPMPFIIGIVAIGGLLQQDPRLGQGRCASTHKRTAGSGMHDQITQ